jgi:hypothetical protein
MSEIDKDIKMRSDMVGEPVGAVALDYPNVALAEEELSDVPLGKYGFYTSDPDEFEQRVAMIEDALDKVDAGVDDPCEWIQVDDFMAMMRKEHPWL